MSESNKAIYRRYIHELFNEGRLDKLNELVSSDYVLHNAAPGTPKGPDAIRQVVSMFRAGFPNLEVTLEALLEEGDLVASRGTMRGTHKGTFFGIPPTGNSVILPTLTIVRIADGKICESWVQNDRMDLMRQLGVTK